MRVPQYPQFVPAQVLSVSGSALPSRVSAAHGHDVSAGKFRLLRQQLRQRLVNLRVPFGKSLAEFIRNALHLKIPAWPVADLVAERPQFAGEFMVVDVLGKLPGAQQFVIFQSLPAIFHRIERRVENNAVRVQMRIKGAGRVVREQRGGEIAREPVALCATDANASCRESLKFSQCRCTARA